MRASIRVLLRRGYLTGARAVNRYSAVKSLIEIRSHIFQPMETRDSDEDDQRTNQTMVRCGPAFENRRVLTFTALKDLTKDPERDAI